MGMVICHFSINECSSYYYYYYRRSTADESIITGESMAVPKKPGDKIIGGTINLNGTVNMRAIRVGSETGLAQVTEKERRKIIRRVGLTFMQIIRLVEQAQADKAPIQNYADKVSAYHYIYFFII